MKKLILTVILSIALLALIPPKAGAVSITVDGTEINSAVLYGETTYVPIRVAAKLLSPRAEVLWKNGTAVVISPSVYISARPGDYYIQANGRYLFASQTVKLENGSTMVPIRAITKAMGGAVEWNAQSQTATVYSGNGTIISGDQFYNSDEVYWLSQIINAESAGETIKGKIAVGNVIMNRTYCPEFSGSIYDVIFDTAGGTQFTPVANGTIYTPANDESIIAAKLCLDGASVAGNSLFFFNPKTATSSWIRDNRPFYAAIGNHYFYA